MPAPAPGALWFEPRGEAWSREFLRRLASLASATPFGTAWLVARRSSLPGVVVVPGDGVAREVVSAAAVSVPGRLAPVGDGALGSPGPNDRFAVVARSGWGGAPSVPDGPAPERAPREPPPVVPSDPPTGEGGIQCHWFSTGSGRIALRLRVWVRTPGRGEPAPLPAWTLPAVERLAFEGIPARSRELAMSARRREAWRRGRIGGFAAGPLERVLPPVAADVASGPGLAPRVDDSAIARHVVVVGASGAGKTSFLADLAAARIARGAPVLAVDLHGDLGPAIAARVGAGGDRSLLAVDASGPPGSIPGVRLLGGGGPGGGDGRGAAHVVAALKRLTSDAGDVYWGFRLERTLDVFVRLAQEEGGGLGDLYALLTDARRRDAARLTTRLPAAAAFLDELPALLRRNPEYLVPAAARVAKVAFDARLLALLDARGPELSVVTLVAQGRSVVWRLPFAELGPEAASFAATLLLTHAYLALAARPRGDGPVAPVAIVVDEASALSPRLVAELLTDSRKFGLGVVLATQYPERLVPEARAAAEGAAGTHVVFRVPAPVAADTARWAGLEPSLAPMLAALPDGTAWVVRSGDGGGRGVVRALSVTTEGDRAWEEAVSRTSADEAWDRRDAPADEDDRDDAVVFALAAGPARRDEVAERLGSAPPGAAAIAPVADALERLRVRGWVRTDGGTYSLTEAGSRYLGVGAPTGAVSEGAAHRALLYRALGVLARRGARLELIRQGRFDRRLPDAVVRQLPPTWHALSPADLAAAVGTAQRRWAWRYFGGRDVDVEAEVSGALRPDRLRRNLSKARARGTFALFLVGDAARARRVRVVLAAEGAGRAEACVWTLGDAEARRQAAGAATGVGSGGAGAGPAARARC
jgi:hypothetical protein